jgi:sensor histidine kinase regulating citrate/malate metabolism
MFKKFFKKEAFPTRLFIIVSLINFFVLIVFSFFLIFYLSSGGNENRNKISGDDRFF